MICERGTTRKRRRQPSELKSANGSGRETHVLVERGRDRHLVDVLVKARMRAKVRADDKLGKHLVLDRVDRVLDDAEDVEPRKDGLGELDILLERDRRVVPAADRVGGGNDGTPGLKRGDDAGL